MIKNSDNSVIIIDIGAIVNCTPRLENSHEKIEYFRVPVNDRDKSESDKQKIKLYLPQATAFIHINLTENKKVLVHCMSGITRSATVVVAYLMRYEKMTLNEAIVLVREKRPKALTNVRYIEALQEFSVN